MLFSFRNGACALVAALTLGAPASMADHNSVYVHSVLIHVGGFFPAKVYATVGDRIEFTNLSPSSHGVKGPNESWESGNIHKDEVFSLVLTEDTPLTFQGEWPGGNDSEEDDIPGGTIVGEISYDEPPLEEDVELLDQEYVN